MKRISYILTCLLTVACTLNNIPYESLVELNIRPDYPESFPEDEKEGLSILITDKNLSNSYTVLTDSKGEADIALPQGIYRINLSHKSGQVVYNGVLERLVLKTKGEAVLELKASKAGDLVIKEIYCGGCSKYPEEGNYASDSYIILHNNSSSTIFLDSLCFATLDPYRSGATNVWEDIDFLPVVQAIWQIGGTGTSFPLESGKDAVIVIFGAIDHTVMYPLSVNLNNADYFVCYNSNYFANTTYHPAPGPQIRPDHLLNVVAKVGIANAYVFAQQSPAPVIFRAPEGTDLYAYVQANIIQKPGSTVDQIIKLPYEWVIDGVEVFEKGANNKKRFPEEIDAGAIEFSGPHYGHTLFRKTDEQYTNTLGFEVLIDTNNSTNDFYERETQSLHEN